MGSIADKYNAGRPKITDLPLAAPGLASYRYRGPYGWIMIGATDEHDAAREALRSLESGTVYRNRLERYDILAGRYVPLD
jgi:hypothetical protein